MQLVKDIAEGNKLMTNDFIPLIGFTGGITAKLLNWSQNKGDNKRLNIELFRVQAELSAMREVTQDNNHRRSKAGSS